MPFWVGYYHIIWATKYRQPIITSACEPIIHQAINRKVAQLKCHIYTMNGVADHIHIAMSIPPSLTVAYVISQLKGASSYEINHTFPNQDAFHWQGSYGGLTFGEKALPFVLDYIHHQKIHHRDGTSIAYLENTAE